MRCPPPIPRLRVGLVFAVDGDRWSVTDRGLGQTQDLGAGPWRGFAELLSRSALSQQRLSEELEVTRFDAHQMVQRGLRLHLFETARAVDQRRSFAASTSFARRGIAPRSPMLMPFERAAPYEVGVFRRLGSPDRLESAQVIDFIRMIDQFMAARHARFASDERFASREAFQIVRADPEAIPHRLRRQMGGVLAVSQGLPLHVRAGLEALLYGKLEGFRLPPVPTTARERRRRLARRGLVPAVAEGLMLRGIQALAPQPLRPSDRRALVTFFSTHRDCLTELFFVQAPLLLGFGGPRACPSWWTC